MYCKTGEKRGQCIRAITVSDTERGKGRGKRDRDLQCANDRETSKDSQREAVTKTDHPETEAKTEEMKGQCIRAFRHTEMGRERRGTETIKDRSPRNRDKRETKTRVRGREGSEASA